MFDYLGRIVVLLFLALLAWLIVISVGWFGYITLPIWLIIAKALLRYDYP